MKKILIILFVLTMTFSSSAHADWNVQYMTDEELIDFRQAVNEELLFRRLAEAPSASDARPISEFFPDPVLAGIVCGEVGAIDTTATIAQEELDTIKEINVLSKDDGLTSLEGIEYLHGLKKLSLYYQSGLTEIPESIGTLVNLKKISFEKCGISELPASICNLTNLKELNVSNTAISVLPEDIGNLYNLEVLNIKETIIEELPDSIKYLSLEKFYR